MIVWTIALACLVMPAARLAGQDASSASPKDPRSEVDVSRLLSDLARKTGEFDSFVATYRTEGTEEGKEEVMVLTYDAPGRARNSFRGPDGWRDVWILDGRMIIREEFGQGAIKAEVDSKAIFDFGERFETALRDEFPGGPDAADDLGAGPAFGLEIVPDESHPSGHALRANLGWDASRTHVLKWLKDVEGWTAADRYEKRLVREMGPDAAIGLSLESGFIDEIRAGKSVRLVDLEVNQEVSDSVFVVTAASPNARDVASEIREQYLYLARTIARNRVYLRTVKRAETAGVEDAALQASMRVVFRELHAAVLARHHADWIERTKSWSAERIKGWSDYLKVQGKNDPAARTLIIRTATAQRESLAQLLDEKRESHIEGLLPPAIPDMPPGLLEAVAAAERIGARDAYESEVANAVLTDFDEGVSEALGGE